MNEKASKLASFEAFNSFIILTRILAWLYDQGRNHPEGRQGK
jgi:hypothetical protein